MPSEQDPTRDGEAGVRGANDQLILAALAKLEDPATRTKLKLTVESLRALSGLSTNAIRSRDWALTKLKELKKAEKESRVKQKEAGNSAGTQASVSSEAALKMRIDGLLQENSLLFEEILSLRREIKKRNEYIENLQGRRLAIL